MKWYCHLQPFADTPGQLPGLLSEGRGYRLICGPLRKRINQSIILQFRPQSFWELTTRYREVVFKYNGQRFEQPEKAQSLLDKITRQPFITGIAGKESKEQPPQLFDLTTLQCEVNKQHGLSAAATLTATQNLYEAKLVTYQRTDSRYLSKDLKSRVPKIMEQLKAMRAEQIAPLNLAKLPFTTRIIDDTKVTDHHAIIPTGVRPRNLGVHDQLVYDAITTQFIAAFYPVCVKHVTTVDGISRQVKFQAKGTQVIEPGWTILFPKKKMSQDAADDQALRAFTKGEAGPHEPSLREGKTKPPSHFTENLLLGAMEAAGKFVEDDTLREALKERGIGTPATRAAIIETLLRRNYIQREKKQLRCTDMGRTLIEHSSTRRLDPARWGSCPLCGKEVIKGNRAYGCSGWAGGCPFVLEAECKGVTLTPRQVQTLLQLRVLQKPVRIENEPRIFILSTQGLIMDLRLPSSDRQKNIVKNELVKGQSSNLSRFPRGDGGK